MKNSIQRLTNIAGQIEGVKKMIESRSNCVKTLTQLKAIKSAVAGVMDMIVEEQFDSCLQSMKQKDKKLLIQIKKYVKDN